MSKWASGFITLKVFELAQKKVVLPSFFFLFMSEEDAENFHLTDCGCHRSTAWMSFFLLPLLNPAGSWSRHSFEVSLVFWRPEQRQQKMLRSPAGSSDAKFVKLNGLQFTSRTNNNLFGCMIISVVKPFSFLCPASLSDWSRIVKLIAIIKKKPSF